MPVSALLPHESHFAYAALVNFDGQVLLDVGSDDARQVGSDATDTALEKFLARVQWIEVLDDLYLLSDAQLELLVLLEARLA